MTSDHVTDNSSRTGTKLLLQRLGALPPPTGLECGDANGQLQMIRFILDALKKSTEGFLGRLLAKLKSNGVFFSNLS